MEREYAWPQRSEGTGTVSQKVGHVAVPSSVKSGNTSPIGLKSSSGHT